jgi:putative PIN family toxin of toxin-antitoxin system
LPRQFLGLAIRGRFELAISPPIQAEIDRVLRERFLWSAEAAEEQAVRLLRIARLVHPAESIDAVPDDPDDNRILECAVTARSDYVVSGDKHLLRLGSYGGIEIVKVADFLMLAPMQC